MFIYIYRNKLIYEEILKPFKLSFYDVDLSVASVSLKNT